jgi:hypothetical protein
MRKLAILAFATLAASAAAQTTLSTGLTAANQGNVGGGLYFDLQVNNTLTITSINTWLNVGNATTPFNANVSWELWLGPSTYVGNVTNPGLWTKVGATVPQLYTSTGGYTQLTNLAVVPVPQISAVTLAPGNYGFAIKAVGGNNAYTNGVTCTSTSIPGSCSNTSFGNPDLVIRGGAAQNAFLSGGIFQPRMFAGAITYTLGGTPITFAQREPYGAGCYAKYRSFYEFWPSSVAVDYSNTSFRLIYDGANNRYQAVASTTPVAIVTSPSLGHAGNNDIVVPLANSQPIIFPDINGPGVVTTSVNMNSNGYISLNGTVASVDNPTVTAWLTGASARIGYHHNMDPVAGGTTHYDYDAASAAHLFTWNAVPDGGIAATSNTIQLAFFANGDVEFRFGAVSQSGGGSWPTLVGFTPGNGAVDPGSIDITAALPFATSNVDQPALALTSDVNPVLGTTVNLTQANVTGASLGINFVTLANLGPLSPGGLDLALIGAPGCVANVDINTGAGYVVSNIPGIGSLTTPFPIPAGPLSVVGLSFFCQGVWLDASQNAGGLITSNALRLKIGSF